MVTVAQWFRFQRVMLRSKWESWRHGTPPRAAVPRDPADGDPEAAAHWLFYGLSYFFRPAILLSAAFGLAADQKRSAAYHQRLRRVRLFWGAVAAFLVALLIGSALLHRL